jgi:diguanylate cyclase (GGDEF)-like protein
MNSEATPALESRIEALLDDPATSGVELRSALTDLYERCRTQQQMLDRLTKISDKYQLAERERGLSYGEQLQRKVRQVEKIVRISDGFQTMLQELNARLTAIATHDELTKLPNRHYMRERLSQAITQSIRSGETFSLALADIDFFKKINDSIGHAAGDAVLSRMAACMRDCMRDYDLCARWGGEEFLILFSSCDLEHAAQLAERVRMAVAALDIADLHPGLKLTVSMGFTEFRQGEKIDSALKRADDALYQAKNAGRNCVVGSP